VAASSSAVVEKPLSTMNTERLAQTKKGGDNDISYLRSMILGHTAVTPSSSSANALSDAKIGKYIAMDCEMVGVGPASTDERTGKIITESSLARVSLVNYHGEIVMDAFVKQKERVTDYRTHVSGVRSKDLVGLSVLSLEDVQKRVADMLKGRILVGHAVFNDLKVCTVCVLSSHLLTFSSRHYFSSIALRILGTHRRIQPFVLLIRHRVLR
jgi:RNA exonuclease 4